MPRIEEIIIKNFGIDCIDNFQAAFIHSLKIPDGAPLEVYAEMLLSLNDAYCAGFADAMRYVLQTLMEHNIISNESMREVERLKPSDN